MTYFSTSIIYGVLLRTHIHSVHCTHSYLQTGKLCTAHTHTHLHTPMHTYLHTYMYVGIPT